MVAKNSRRSTMLQKKVVVGRIGFIIILAIIVVMAIISVSKFTKLRDSANVARAEREKNSYSSSVYGRKAMELIKEKHGEILRIAKILKKMNKEISLLRQKHEEINSQYKGIEWGNLPYKVRDEVEEIKEGVSRLKNERYMVEYDYKVIYWGFAEKFKELGLLPYPQSPDSVCTE